MPSVTENVVEKTVHTWGDLVRIATTDLSDHARTWYFRGTLPSWNLSTSIERAATDWGLSLNDVPDIEERITRDFRRAFRGVTASWTPPRSDVIGWLALMQHFGAPTRLLDWTYSPFVAAYFALQYLLDAPGVEYSVLWCLPKSAFDPKAVRKHLDTDGRRLHKRYLRKRRWQDFSRLLINRKRPVRLVAPINPYELHQRLVIQQGIFLCPGDVTLPFESNLERMTVPEGGPTARRYRLTRDILRDGFAGLQRMNISRATLFPGIDGFAQHYRYKLRFIKEVEMYRKTKT
jgi:hypothetical protein